MSGLLLRHEELIDARCNAPLRPRDIPIHPLALQYPAWNPDELLRETIRHMREDIPVIRNRLPQHPYASVRVRDDNFSMALGRLKLQHPYSDFSFTYSTEQGLEVCFTLGDATNIAIGGEGITSLSSIDEAVITTGLLPARLEQFSYRVPGRPYPVVQLWHQHNPHDTLTDFFFRNAAIAANNLAVSQLNKV